MGAIKKGMDIKRMEIISLNKMDYTRLDTNCEATDVTLISAASWHTHTHFGTIKNKHIRLKKKKERTKEVINTTAFSIQYITIFGCSEIRYSWKLAKYK